MSKLTYKNTSNLSVDIDLHNGYTVRVDAKYNKETKRYDAEFYIKENTIDRYVAIDDVNNENVTFDGNKRKIKIAILKYVSWLKSMGKFKNCIKQFEYETKCFEKGYDFFEEERTRHVCNAK